MGRLAQVFAVLAPLAVFGAAPAEGTVHAPPRAPSFVFEARSLDGRANNTAHPAWGRAGTPYRRVAAPRYGNRAGSQAGGPNARYVSNRVFNDLAQNLFSERGLSQWAWTWGQFMDHTFGLAKGGGEDSPIAFDPTDPIEGFRNDIGFIPFGRDAAAAGTGTSATSPRQQINTVSSYIDGWSVYGGTTQRLEWLREGPLDGNIGNNGAHLLIGTDGYLPRASARGAAGAAPAMAVNGQLAGHPQDAAVAGDVRANENMALTAVHTLFVREHNRIVDALPPALSQEQKFQIARRIVGAEQQYITYNEFLPALGVKLAPYGGYKRSVNASLGNEFATVAYRAHSMIHGEFELSGKAEDYTPDQLEAIESMGVEAHDKADEPGGIEFTVPLNVAFFNPDLVPDLGLGPILTGLANETQYKNDEQIDNALRSVLFELPGPDAPDPEACFEDPRAEGCFQAVVDLGAIDIQRARDHGIGTYNQLRRAFGLPARRSFTGITGESADSFSSDPEIDLTDPIDDPSILDFMDLRDAQGNPVLPGSDDDQGAVIGIRRSTLAARLKAIYGSVDKVDAFVGMIAEPHAPGTDLGPLQRAMWRQQFEALRAGDRFFYRNDPVLDLIRLKFGITYRHRLSELIALDAGVPSTDLPANVFFKSDEEAPPG